MSAKYWYQYIHYECTECGKSKVVKVRMETRRPKFPYLRHLFEQRYDGCLDKELSGA